MMSRDETKWLQSLQSFLNGLLQPIIKNQSERNRYLDANAMKIWATAFTHETVSPSDNYEDLEFLGDAMLKAVFPKYLMKRFPHLHKGEYTELNVAYMSKIKQAELAQSMGLNNHIRVAGIERSILNLDTDVFESFFGALDTISDAIVPGIGFSNCYNMILNIFQNIDIDESKGRGSAKTQVIQMFVRFDLPKPIEYVDDGKEITVIINPNAIKFLKSQGMNITDKVIGYNTATQQEDARCEAYGQAISSLVKYGILTVNEAVKRGRDKYNVDFSVALKSENVNFLRENNVNLKNSVIGHATASTKKEAEFVAYNQALTFLENQGITTEWAETEKQRRDFEQPEVSKYFEAAGERAVSEGFQYMYFFTPRKTVTPKGAVVQLVGVRANGKHEVLAYTYALERENSYLLAKALVVKLYALGFQFNSFVVPNERSTPQGILVQLMGTKVSGEKEVLSYIYALNRDNNYHEAKITIIKEYIAK